MSVYMSITVESRSQHRSNNGAVDSTPTRHVDIYIYIYIYIHIYSLRLCCPCKYRSCDAPLLVQCVLLGVFKQDQKLSKRETQCLVACSAIRTECLSQSNCNTYLLASMKQRNQETIIITVYKLLLMFRKIIRVSELVSVKRCQMKHNSAIEKITYNHRQ